MSTAEIFWNLVFSIIVVVSVIGNVIVIWIICGESLSEFPGVWVVICHTKKNWPKSVSGHLESFKTHLFLGEIGGAGRLLLDKPLSEGICIVVQNFILPTKFPVLFKVCWVGISKAWHKYILTRKIFPHWWEKTLSVLIPDTPDEVGLFPKTFLNWPHTIDDFWLLKCIISTFLTWALSLKWLKSTKNLMVGSWFCPLCSQKRSKS